MNNILSFVRKDLRMPEFFSGIFSETDYLNAQEGNRPVGIYSHTPVLAKPERDSRFIPLVPFAVVNQLVGKEVYTYVHKPDNNNESWSIGIGSLVAVMPDRRFSMLDLMTLAEVKAINLQLGACVDEESIHRFISYSSFVLYEPITTAPLMGLAHRVTLARGHMPTTPTLTGMWVDGPTMHQMLDDGLFDIWSEMLLAEEFV